MRAGTFAFFVISLLLAASPFGTTRSAWAQGATSDSSLQSPIGKVMSAAGSATIEHATVVAVQASLASGPLPAKVGDFVYRGDIVQTGSGAKLGITFTDGSAFNLSANGRMVLDEFVYDPNGKSNSTLFSLSKGSFTFIAGAVAKSGDMKIDTPVGTMGIRGTTPHVEISDDGTVTFATLIEENKSTIADPPRGGSQDRGAAAPRRATERASAPELSAEEAARYNKIFDMDMRICRGC